MTTLKYDRPNTYSNGMFRMRNSKWPLTNRNKELELWVTTSDWPSNIKHWKHRLIFTSGFPSHFLSTFAHAHCAISDPIKTSYFTQTGNYPAANDCRQHMKWAWKTGLSLEAQFYADVPNVNEDSEISIFEFTNPVYIYLRYQHTMESRYNVPSL